MNLELRKCPKHKCYFHFDSKVVPNYHKTVQYTVITDQHCYPINTVLNE